MSIYTSFALYLLLYISSSYLDGLKYKKRQWVLFCLAVVCILTIGLRNPAYWIDTAVYVFSFIDSSTLSTFSFNDYISSYSEKGYYLLCVIIRTFSSSSMVYLMVVGLLSMTFLFKALRRYSLLPVLSLCIYIPRYMLSRDMNQMRAGLAISFVMAFTFLLVSHRKRDELKYFLVCWFASFFHTSMLAAIPIIILNYVRLSKIHIYLGIALAFFVSEVFSQQIIDFISQSETIQDMATDYVDKEGDNAKAYAVGLTNPMIYYQCLILFAYTFLEKRIATLSKYYYVLRNGYFMSTVILIVLCQFAILAGRTSTIFATFEIFMIPMIIKGFPKGYKTAAYLLLLAPLLVFFTSNIN